MEGGGGGGGGSLDLYLYYVVGLKTSLKLLSSLIWRAIMLFYAEKRLHGHDPSTVPTWPIGTAIVNPTS